MMERLYYDDAYLTRFEAKVLSCEPCKEGWRVLLDRSAFYPTSGGQPYDTGTLGGARVTNVEVENGEVVHTTDAPLTAGETAEGVIDWPRRFDHMQQHAADHMIAGCIHRTLRGVTIGLHTGDEVSSIDVQMPDGETHLPPETIRAIEQDVNGHIMRDVPIRCWFPDEKELAELPLRKAPTVTEHVRVVAIGDDEMVACGGTHPSTAGQVGVVKILSCAPARGKMRVTFVAGNRALKELFACYDSAHAASALLTTSAANLPDAVSAMKERVLTQERELTRLKRERLPERAAMLLKDAERAGSVRLISAIVPEEVPLAKELCSMLAENAAAVALIGSVQGGNVSYIFGRSKDVGLSMGDLMRSAAKVCGGKGGGKPDFAQGSGPEAMLAIAAGLAKEALADA